MVMLPPEVEVRLSRVRSLCAELEQIDAERARITQELAVLLGVGEMPVLAQAAAAAPAPRVQGEDRYQEQAGSLVCGFGCGYEALDQTDLGDHLAGCSLGG